MTLKALIFDVDGTLADTEEAHRCSFNQAFQQHDLDWQWSKPAYAQLLRTTGGKERLGVYIDSLTLTAAERRRLIQTIPEIHDTKTDNYTRMARAGIIPLREGVARLIDAAEKAGVLLAIASTTTLRNIEALLCANLGKGALELFSVIGAAAEVSRKKPAPDIYEFVLRELGERKENCVAIEDSANGLMAAKSAGLFTVVTPSYWTRTEDFTAADWVVPSLGSYERPLMELERRLGSTREYS
jgi:HAD superfamily hydrolase (TIGR01509 family)